MEGPRATVQSRYLRVCVCRLTSTTHLIWSVSNTSEAVQASRPRICDCRAIIWTCLMKDESHVKRRDDDVDTLKRDRVVFDWCLSQLQTKASNSNGSRDSSYAGLSGHCERFATGAEVRCDRSHVATVRRNDGMAVVLPQKRWSVAICKRDDGLMGGWYVYARLMRKYRASCFSRSMHAQEAGMLNDIDLACQG